MLIKIDIYLTLFLLLIAFFVDYLFALKLYHLKVFEQWDTLFGSDPVAALNNIGNGWGGGKAGLSHPNFANFFSLPIRGMAKVIAILIPETPDFVIRKQLALIVLPLASALQASFFYLILRRLNLSILQALILSLIEIVSFSQLIFGSTPDSFGLSSLAITTGILLMNCTFQIKNRVVFFAWLVIGIFGAGITITNIIPISILQLFSLLPIERNLKVAVSKTIATAIIAIIVTFFLAFMGGQIYNRDNDSFFNNPSRNEALRTDIKNRFFEFPSTLGNTLFSSKPRIIENETAIRNQHKFQYAFTLKETPALLSANRWFSIVLLGLVVCGAVILIRGSTFDKNLAKALLAIIFYNWVFHSFWGSELFLYSNHWLVSELLLMSGCFRATSIRNHIKAIIGIVIFSCLAINNAKIINFICETLTKTTELT